MNAVYVVHAMYTMYAVHAVDVMHAMYAMYAVHAMYVMCACCACALYSVLCLYSVQNKRVKQTLDENTQQPVLETVDEEEGAGQDPDHNQGVDLLPKRQMVSVCGRVPCLEGVVASFEGLKKASAMQSSSSPPSALSSLPFALCFLE